MLQFSATIKRFASQGEKTGWTYVDVPAELANQLVPGNRKGFRIKGTIDDYNFRQLALIPMGNGDFILTLSATIRKAIRKQKNATVIIKMEVDTTELEQSAELLECLKDAPNAFEKYNKLPPSHKNYYTKWIESAKTEPTKAKRIAATITVLETGQSFGDAIRLVGANKKELLKP